VREAAGLPRSDTRENDCAAVVLEVAILLAKLHRKTMLR
jgi:hypothetical protein